MSNARPAWLPLLVALLVVVLWGATPVVTKLAAAELDPLLIALLRTVCGGLPALPLALLMGVQPPRDRRLWGPLLLSAFCGFVAFPLLFTYGQRQTSAMHGGLILAILPVLTGLYAAFVEHRRPAGRWWAGCLVAFAGEMLLIGGRGLGNGASASLAGDALVLAACLFASLGYVLGGRMAQAGYRSLGTTLWGIVAGSVMVAPLLPWAFADGLPDASPVAWGAVLFLALVTSILGYIGWYWALGAGGIARIGTIQFLQPLSGLVLAFFALGERPTLVLGVATLLILAGVITAQRR
jgi:drug/metabolite transporter (DMT)-like permease